MKLIVYILMTGIAHSLCCGSSDFDDFKIILEPKWQNLEDNPQKNDQFGGQWILAGCITFKKKSKDVINLSTLQLHWHGPKIENLLASLYKKNLDKEFIPVEDNLICDGLWNKKEQTLILTFNKKHNLGPLNIFYLVLTVPPHLENKLKSGFFSIEKNELPMQYNLSMRNTSLSLAFNTT